MVTMNQTPHGHHNDSTVMTAQAVEAHMAQLQAETRAEAATWAQRTATEAAAADRATEELRPQLRTMLARLAVRSAAPPRVPLVAMLVAELCHVFMQLGVSSLVPWGSFSDSEPSCQHHRPAR